MHKTCKFFCPTKDENVVATIELKNAHTLEDSNPKYIYGRFDCSGYSSTKCTMDEKCPLCRKQRGE